MIRMNLDGEPIYEAIKHLLIRRGWKIDETAQETRYGELREFVHPETGQKMTYINAIWAQEEIELRKKSD